MIQNKGWIAVVHIYGPITACLLYCLEIEIF